MWVLGRTGTWLMVVWGRKNWSVFLFVFRCGGGRDNSNMGMWCAVVTAANGVRNAEVSVSFGCSFLFCSNLAIVDWNWELAFSCGLDSHLVSKFGVKIYGHLRPWMVEEWNFIMSSLEKLRIWQLTCPNNQLLLTQDFVLFRGNHSYLYF